MLLVRVDLGMTTGKACAQAAHAAVLAALAAHATPDGRRWMAEGQPKIVLAAADAEELQRHAGSAQRAGLPVHVVHDAGRTQLPAGTLTCCAIGPAADPVIDAVTATLPLL